MYKSIVYALSIGLISNHALAASSPLPKPGLYSLTASVVSASSATECPYGVGPQTTSLPGYSAFVGAQASGTAITLNQDWVIAISPQSPQKKFAYDLQKSTGVLGVSATFRGTAVFGNETTEFSGKTGTYKIVVNPATLAATLTVTDPNCIITYSLSFTRSIPTKFLNLL
jgi:hypothetical protein